MLCCCFVVRSCGVFVGVAALSVRCVACVVVLSDGFVRCVCLFVCSCVCLVGLSVRSCVCVCVRLSV